MDPHAKSDDEDLFSILAMCEALHNHNTGTGGTLGPERVARYVTALDARLVGWADADGGDSDYDAAVSDLIVAALAETRREMRADAPYLPPMPPSSDARYGFDLGRALRAADAQRAADARIAALAAPGALPELPKSLGFVGAHYTDVPSWKGGK